MPDPSAVSAAATRPPFLRVERGAPDAAELAAVVTALAALRARGAQAAPDGSRRPDTGWAAYWRSLGAPVPTAPGAWAAAGVGQA